MRKTVHWNDDDRRFMGRAIELAEGGRGRVSPNPLVGAVLAQSGQIVGEGFHRRVGAPHAEVEALESASEARGATLYTTLEPCTHWGRTPPCVGAIQQAGVSEVVVGATDPNPKVAGKGIRKLQKAGITVRHGLLQDRVCRQNETYIKFMETGRPFVLLKAAVTLNGRVEAPAGKRWITGPKARERAHELRAECDAIAVGIGTVLADDPLLTCRLKGRAEESPLRVILDSRGRMPLDSKIVTTARAAPTVVAVTSEAPAKEREALAEAGLEVLVLAERNGRVDLLSLLDELGRRDVSSLLVECGPAVASSFIRAKLADKMVIMMAPRIADDGAAGLVKPGVTAEGFVIDEVLPVGSDLAVFMYPPWALGEDGLPQAGAKAQGKNDRGQTGKQPALADEASSDTALAEADWVGSGPAQGAGAALKSGPAGNGGSR